MAAQTNTQALQFAFDPAANNGSTSVPIYQNNAFAFESCDHAANVFNLADASFLYTRLNNPTTDVLERRLAAIDGGIGAVATACGMSAISTTILTLLKSGDHIVSSSSVYGGTYNLLSVTLPRLGITTTFVNPDDPKAFEEKILRLQEGQRYSQEQLKRDLVLNHYVNDRLTFTPGYFRVKGDTIDIFPSIEGFDGVAYRVTFWDDEIERIASFDPQSGREYGPMTRLIVHPANLFVTTQEQVNSAVGQIDVDLGQRVQELEDEGRAFEAKRLYERTTYDLEMIRELGYCSGIENYSRYFDGRQPGERPFCLLDYFPNDFLLIIDESHVTVPQIHAMYGGDRSRKTSLVEYGFRLPAALDNRPLKFEEFDDLTPRILYISATPAEYELTKSEGVVVEQLIRPTGLLDPPIEVRPTLHQVDDLEHEIQISIERGERVLVTTLTKRMAEELSEYLIKHGVSCSYIHSDVDTLTRVQIMEDLRKGVYDVLIGVNLLREGLDLPEVALVAVLDADKEGFLRSHRSLTQTAGRAARNVNGRVIFYADHITESMRLTMDETARRRAKQIAYNEANGITPQQIVKNSSSAFPDKKGSDEAIPYIEASPEAAVEDPIEQFLSLDQLRELAETKRSEMMAAAKELNFVDAARLRNELQRLEEKIRLLQ